MFINILSTGCVRGNSFKNRSSLFDKFWLSMDKFTKMLQLRVNDVDDDEVRSEFIDVFTK